MAYYLRLDGDEREKILSVPVPVPPHLACSMCPLRGSRRGWSCKDRHAQALKHFQERHGNDVTVRILFRCSCGLDFASLHEGNHHQRRDCQSQEHQSDEDAPLDTVTITLQPISPGRRVEQSEGGDPVTNYFTMDWPVGRLMACCLCHFKSEAPKDSLQADSIRHHLFRDHDIVGKRRWK